MLVLDPPPVGLSSPHFCPDSHPSNRIAELSTPIHRDAIALALALQGCLHKPDAWNDSEWTYQIEMLCELATGLVDNTQELYETT